jgi:glycosyltransferase involved in cell wall biosynthesis
MRVANITEEGRYGGPQGRIVDVASRLPEHGIDPLVVCPSFDSERFRREMDEEGIEYVTTILHRLTREAPMLARYVAGFAPEIVHLARIFERENVELVHGNGSWQIKGMIAAKLAGVTTAWHLNDTNMPAPVRGVFHALAPTIADGFIAASKRTRRYYLEGTRLESKPSAIIQAPVDTDVFDPDRVEPASMLNEYSGLKVSTVATINPVKSIEDFIEAARLVGDMLEHEIHFFVVGPIHDSQQAYGRRLREQARDIPHVHFTGASDEVPRVLKATDVYVCSSSFEASPISVWEAMSMARPIVSTDVGDVAEHLEGEMPRGAVVPTGDTEAIAEHVAELAEHPEARKRLGRRARRWAREHFDVDVCVRRHANFYRRLDE